MGELSQRRAEINALNVFPVPDADTGSNMAHTMAAALAQVDRGGDVAEALAVGSVRGARGNSGMVLSQVLRAVADSTQDSVVDAVVLNEALQLAVKLVTAAIADPVEGTVVTVLRAAAAASEQRFAADGEVGLHGLLAEVIAAARDALERTPSQLPALREAGVVDAGGAGLVILLECLMAELAGDAVPEAAEVPEPTAELEVLFYFTGDVDALAAELAPMGNSLVIAREGREGPDGRDGTEGARVHIHSAQAGAVIERAFARGAVSDLRLEILPAPPAGTQTTDSGRASRRVFAIAPAGPVAELFAAVGAQVVDPAAGRVDAAAGDIVVLNGADCDAGPARVVPTQSLVAGVAAISVYEPANPDADAVVAAMSDAAASMRVARPPANSLDAIVLSARKLLAEGGEQVTILTPLEVDSAALTARLGVETMVMQVPGLDTEIGVE